jgi:hypothetical protein
VADDESKERFVVYGPGKRERTINHVMNRDGLPACGARLSYVIVGKGYVGCSRCLKFLEELEKYKFLKEE